jgi:hypothetical protein
MGAVGAHPLQLLPVPQIEPPARQAKAAVAAVTHAAAQVQPQANILTDA